MHVLTDIWAHSFLAADLTSVKRQVLLALFFFLIANSSYLPVLEGIIGRYLSYHRLSKQNRSTLWLHPQRWVCVPNQRRVLRNYRIFTIRSGPLTLKNQVQQTIAIWRAFMVVMQATTLTILPLLPEAPPRHLRYLPNVRRYLVIEMHCILIPCSWSSED